MRRGRRDIAGRGTDLPVMLPAAEQLAARAALERESGGPIARLQAWHGLVLLAILVLAAAGADAQAAGEARDSVFVVLMRWTPLMLWGFGFNILISLLAMALGTVLGTALGLMQVSLLAPVRGSSWLLTQFFRNAPWLVLLFFCMFLLPFEFRVAGLRIPFPDWIKAVLGLSLPVMANVSEIVRGAVQSIPSGQWEASYSLGFSRRQTLGEIILPQCIKRMLPPWMNLYAILTMATVLASVVGVAEVMTITQRVLGAEARGDLLLAFYSYILLWFFLYCYPIARLTQRLELRYAVNS